MTVYDFWVLEAPELWTMGYRKCAPEHADDEQTITYPGGSTIRATLRDL
jgi:hypothetical protein